MLELEDVVKHYRGAAEEVRAVDGVSLTIAAGEMCAVLGPSGSGKTTLLLLIAALLKPDQGTIRFEGREVSSFTEAQASEYLLHDVGFVFQGFHLMPRVSAIDNAARKLIIGGLGLRDAHARAIPWLERVGLSDRLQNTPETLSGGERQRVAIARALACEPHLILADEPTGNLDSARSHDIVQLLGSVARERGASVLLVTHDRDAAALADNCYTLRDGQLIEGDLKAEAEQTRIQPLTSAATAKTRGHERPLRFRASSD